jgi:plastocyanin
MDGVSYAPAALIVKRGDTVVWRNKDPFPHTVTAPGKFDSGSIAASRSWKLVARKPGVYPYLCTLHPNMQGTLTVE